MSSPKSHPDWMDSEFDFDMSPTDRDRLQYEQEMRRKEEEVRRKMYLSGTQNAQNQQGAYAGALANEMANAMQQAGISQQDIHRYLSGGRKLGGQSPLFVGAAPIIPPMVQGQQNMQFPGIQAPPPPPPALDDTSPAADEAQREALAAMNPLARFKFGPLFKVLEIKVRFTNMVRAAGGGTAWILAKMGADGKMIRQEWSAPSKDPGCSMRTWEAMMGELMDEVTRRKGIHVATDADHSAESTGAEGPGSSAGNP